MVEIKNKSMAQTCDESYGILSRTNWKNVSETNYQLAMLPWGATEAHNYHLPYSTDNIQCTYIAEEVAKRLWKEDCKTIVLPCVPFGVQTAQMDVKFNINMKPSTQFAVLKDIVESLENQGLKKLVIINGHGANSFVHMIRELYSMSKVRIFTLNWYDSIDSKEFFEEPGDHAGELETSVMLHIAPDLVLPLKEAGNGKAKKIKVKALKEGWIWTQRGWLNQVTSDTGVGNPKKSNPEKGRDYINKVIDKVSIALKEVAQVDLNDLYE